MIPRVESAPGGRRFPWNGYLWLLAAILGAATVHAMMTVVHDTSQRRRAAQLVTRTVAERIAATASLRLEAAALPALAPASGFARDTRGRLVLEHLARDQAAAERCACRPMLPASGFFIFDVRTDSLDLLTTGEGASISFAAREALRDIARTIATHDVRGTAAATVPVAPEGEPPPSSVSLHLDSALGAISAVAFMRRDTRGFPINVVGLVAPTRDVMAQLFTGAADGLAPTSDEAPPLVRLDRASLEVRSAEGRIVMGGLDSTRRFRATVTPPGALDDVAITVALLSSQIAAPLLSPISAPQLWHLAAVMLATVVVLAIAVRASRREALLARARSDFIAGVSHELRMPLAQILLAGETLTMQRERDDAARMGLASSIVREARRLIALVENVLLFSRTGAVALRPFLEPVAAGALLADVVEAVELAVADAGQHIETVAPTPIIVVADRTLIRQALVNLVDNAIKYGTAGQRIRLVVETPTADVVRLIVEDEGRGVPHPERGRVFEPYARLERDQSSERTGTGLGLAVVRQIVAACRGKVWLEAGPAGGTRAVLELPAATLARGTAPVVA